MYSVFHTSFVFLCKSLINIIYLHHLNLLCKHIKLLQKQVCINKSELACYYYLFIKRHVKRQRSQNGCLSTVSTRGCAIFNIWVVIRFIVECKICTKRSAVHYIFYTKKAPKVRRFANQFLMANWTLGKSLWTLSPATCLYFRAFLSEPKMRWHIVYAIHICIRR